jgi:hypothetical protein
MEAFVAEPMDWNDTRKDWRGAFVAIRKLLADPKDTVQVFRVMQGLNRGTAARNYQRLLKTPEGGRIAYRRVELAIAPFSSAPAFRPTGLPMSASRCRAFATKNILSRGSGGASATFTMCRMC